MPRGLIGCWNKKGGSGHDLSVLTPWTPYPTTNLDSWEWFLAGRARAWHVGGSGSVTHMADGEGHSHNGGVINTRRRGEDAGEERRRVGKKEAEVLVSCKEKDIFTVGHL